MIFYKRCPNCLNITGFDLDNLTIKLDEEYFCQFCSEENKLSKWGKSTKNAYIKQHNPKK